MFNLVKNGGFYEQTKLIREMIKERPRIKWVMGIFSR